MKRKIITIVLLTICSIQTLAQGNLLITPIRVVFEGNKQNEEFNLVNTGTDTTTFSISFIQFRMKEDGSMVKTDETEAMQWSAAPYLRIYPTRVVLAPGEPQVIRLQYRRKPDMLAGEYRSHLYFRAEKDRRPLGLPKPQDDTTQLSIQLTAVYGLCLPVIIRTNESTVSSTLTDLKLVNPPSAAPHLEFTINRSGNISTYGDIVVEYIPLQGKPVQVALIRGIGVYPEVSKRNVVVTLNIRPGLVLTKGKMKVSYITNDASKKPVLYSDSELGI